VEFRILGPLEVVEGDRQVRVSGARERAPLAVLLIHAGEVVSAGQLIDDLWGSDLPATPERVAGCLRNARWSAGDASAGDAGRTSQPGG
jgi:DNA-binding SARP family transcriptional activator